jgi:cell division cycle protein 20 (cofactor of APC complex)
MDIASYLLTEPPRKGKENNAAPSPSREAYRRLLAEKLLNNRTRILAFRNRQPEPDHADAASIQAKPSKKHRCIPQVCHAYFCATTAHWLVAIADDRC